MNQREVALNLICRILLGVCVGHWVLGFATNLRVRHIERILIKMEEDCTR